MPCKETDCKCEATKTELIADGHDKYGNCKNPKCDHPVLNHTDASTAGRKPVVICDLDGTILTKIAAPANPRFPRFPAVADALNIYGSALECDAVELFQDCFVKFRRHAVFALMLLAAHFELHVVSRACEGYVRKVVHVLTSIGIRIESAQSRMVARSQLISKSFHEEAKYILDDEPSLWAEYLAQFPRTTMIRVLRMSPQDNDDTLRDLLCEHLLIGRLRLVPRFSPRRWDRQVERPIPVWLLRRMQRSLLYNLPGDAQVLVLACLDDAVLMDILAPKKALPSRLRNWICDPSFNLAGYFCGACGSFFPHVLLTNCPGCAELGTSDSSDSETETMPKRLKVEEQSL